MEIDLVEHNGGSSLGHLAYTLTVVDVVTGYSRRRAMLGRSQKAVFQTLSEILGEWPSKVWAFIQITVLSSLVPIWYGIARQMD